MIHTLSDLPLNEQKNLLIECTDLGVSNALRRLGLVKDEISQREAYRRFGEARVRSWVNRGLVKRIKSGNNNSKVTYSLIELETVARLEDARLIK